MLLIDGNFHDLHAYNMKDNTMNKKDAQEILNLNDMINIINQEQISKDDQYLSSLVDHIIGKSN